MTNLKSVSPNKNDTLSRVRNAARDTAVSFVAFRKADKRLYDALKDARDAGASYPEIERAIMSAGKGNPKVQSAIEEYSKELREASKNATTNFENDTDSPENSEA